METSDKVMEIPDRVLKHVEPAMPALSGKARERVSAALVEALACPECGKDQALICYHCRNSAGGSTMSPKRFRLLKRISRLPRPNARGPRGPRLPCRWCKKAFEPGEEYVARKSGSRRWVEHPACAAKQVEKAHA